MRSIIVCLSVMAVFLTFSNGFSQDKPEQVVISTAEIVDAPVPDPAVSEVVRNITNARINEDINAQRYWESKLHELTKPQIISGSDSFEFFGFTNTK